MISVIAPTNRIGGLDILASSLRQQTFQDFELVLVDAIRPFRKDLTFWSDMRVQWLDPGSDEKLTTNYMHSMNMAIEHARGDTIVFMPDYAWLHPDCLATHAEMQQRHRGPITLDYNYAELPPLKPGVPNYREKCSGDSLGYVAEVNANTARYVADLRAGKLDDFLWSIFAEPLTDEAVRALPIEHRHRPSGADLSNDWNFCSLKNESMPTELLLDMNGLDEAYDGGHLYQDSELSYRLRERGIRWHAGAPEAGLMTVVNPRGIMNIKHLEKPLSHNQELCFGSRRAELRLPVNPGRSLRAERAVNL